MLHRVPHHRVAVRTTLLTNRVNMHRVVIARLVKSIISPPHHRPAFRRKSTRSTLAPPKTRPLDRTMLRVRRTGRNTSRNKPRSLHLRKRSKASRHSHNLRQRITTSILSAPRLPRPKTVLLSPPMRPTAKVKVRAEGRSLTKRKIKTPTEI